MHTLIRETRLILVTWLLQLALRILPKDCTRTLFWFSQMPIEDFEEPSTPQAAKDSSKN
jgi:hypothetical protein